MTDAAAIAGTFANIVPVKTRSTVQIIIEIPVEAADAALKALGGYPQPGKEVPVAVARLHANSVPKNITDNITGDPEPEPVAKQDKRAWADLAPSVQAALRCKDVAFQDWCAEHCPPGWLDNYVEREALAADWVRDVCSVETRAALSVEPEAKAAWGMMNLQFEQDTGRMAVQTS